MLDGIELKERTHIVCLGITTEGVKIPRDNPFPAKKEI